LLEFRRAHIRAVAEELELPFRDDPDNASPRFRRNVLRTGVIPDLAQRFNPNLVASMNRTAAHLAADDAVLLGAAEAVPIVVDHGAVLLPVPVLQTLPQGVAARAVRRALRRAHPPYPGEAADVDAVLAVANRAVHAAEVSGGFRVEREGAMVAVYRPQPPALPSRVGLPVPGSGEFGPWKIAAMVSDRRPRTRWETSISTPDRVASHPLTVRAPEDGERIDVGTGSKPVREALSEAGVPARLRAGWPVVAAGGRIAWLVGARRAVWAKPDASPAVHLTAERTGS
jgi:tRNA(Ile)-lysidine synthetase-like protein